MNKMLKQNNKPWVYVQVNLDETPIGDEFIRNKQINPDKMYCLSYVNPKGEKKDLYCSGGDLEEIRTKRGISGKVDISGPIKIA